MIAIRKLLQALKDRASRRDTSHANRRRAHVAMEHLDHRQLMAVNFTGNVITDFPATTSPGVVVVRPSPTDPNYRIPQIPSEPGGLNDIIKVSGLQLDAIRVSYDSEQDILSVGIEQPLNQKTNQRVIAGDTDNNLNGATVAPEVQALPIFFEDPGLLGGSETMYVTLDLLNNNNPADPTTRADDVVAGITNGIDPSTGLPLPKSYQVAAYSAVPERSGFGDELPLFVGTSFLANAPDNGGFEFQIRRFSELYQLRTGQPLTSQRIVQIAANADSAQDDGISEAAIPFLAFNVGDATEPLPPPPPPPPPPDPPPPPPCPVNPPVIVNPHENRHINTAHNGLIRAYIFGTDYLDVRQIVPESVRLGGAAPVRPPHFQRQNGDLRVDATFYFQGDQINLPRGITTATVTGVLRDGTPFSGSSQVFNRDRSFYGAAANAAQMIRSSIKTTWREQVIDRISSRRAVLRSRAADASATLTPGVRNGLARSSRVAITAAPGTIGGPVVTLKTRSNARRLGNPEPAAASFDAWDQALQAADVPTNRRRPFVSTPARPAMKVDMGAMEMQSAR